LPGRRGAGAADALALEVAEGVSVAKAATLHKSATIVASYRMNIPPD